MRKLFLAIVLMFSLAVHAQYNGNHIKFLGIPLGQQLHMFVFHLKQKGFKDDKFLNSLWAGTGDNIYSMNGLFMGVNNQSISIHYTSSKIVNEVSVMYDHKSWNSAYKQYWKIKSMLTQKYGKPNKSVEKFSNPIPKDDRGKIKAIQTEKGKYTSTYNVDSGIIEIKIDCYNNTNESNVVLSYEDSSIKERKPIDDL